MNDAVRKKRAQVSIRKAMKAWLGPRYVEQPGEAVKCDRYRDELTREQLDQGVVALVAHCNLGGGSAGNVDLYKLLRTYLWDEEARVEINSIVDGKSG